MTGIASCGSFFSTYFCCRPSTQSTNSVPHPRLEGNDSLHDSRDTAPFRTFSAADSEEEVFKPNWRFTIIFSELWKNNKSALFCCALFIIAAVLVNLFVDVISIGTLSIPAAVVTTYLCASGSTCIWTALVRSCIEGNKQYGYQQRYKKEFPRATTNDYKTYFQLRMLADYHAKING